MSREFSTREKVLLVVLVLMILGFVYYRFVDQPIRREMAEAEAERASLQSELAGVRSKIRELQRMRDEIDEITAGGRNSYMPSYNSAKAELALLNDILNRYAAQYSVSFTSVTRSGDQIRREFKLEFTAADYDSVGDIIDKLTGVEYRCMLGDCDCSAVEVRNAQGREETALSVSTTATFFETMAGGTADAGLPPDSPRKG